MNRYQQHVEKEGNLPSCTNPGGYPIFYFDDRDNVYCDECASGIAEHIKTHRVHWEGAPIECSVCDKEIESAYGNPEEEEQPSERK